MCAASAELWYSRFLDRCDPDSPSQPDVCQGWVEHPLLEHVVTQPDAMVVLLQLLQEVQQLRPAAAAGVGSGGGLSPGPVILAMLLKLGTCAYNYALTSSVVVIHVSYTLCMKSRGTQPIHLSSVVA